MGIISRFIMAVVIMAVTAAGMSDKSRPWDNGRLKASDNKRFLMHENGTPFFWLGQTAWLLPERLDRDETAYFLSRTAEQGYNIVQIQVVNDVPAFNAYGKKSMPAGFDFSAIADKDGYGYWDHLDYIVDVAAGKGIYVGMVCIWGGLVKSGKMDKDQAVAYGKFLAERYRDRPNIIWIIGGDIEGSVKTEVWDTLARTIKKYDSGHLMTFHPRGRTTSARWFANREWLDFHTFQSGHRRYGQRMGNKDYPIPDNTEEDNWMYVDSTWNHLPIRPVLDSEPSYEDIPQGLHGKDEPKWKDKDIRRYAYWSVFAGSCGHTYGHNAIMQFVRPGVEGAYFADGDIKPWWKALDDPGCRQMVYLKELIERFPYFDRKPMQHTVRRNGKGYDRLAATGGDGYLLIYNHTGRPMDIDASGIKGEKKIWWMDASDGSFRYIGEAKDTVEYSPESGADGVLVITSLPVSFQ